MKIGVKAYAILLFIFLVMIWWGNMKMSRQAEQIDNLREEVAEKDEQIRGLYLANESVNIIIEALKVEHVEQDDYKDHIDTVRQDEKISAVLSTVVPSECFLGLRSIVCTLNNTGSFD